MKTQVVKQGISTVLFVGLLALVTASVTSAIDPANTDATADWLSVNAAFDGLDPWADLTELADVYSVNYGPLGIDELQGETRTAPRTPGALLLLSPHTLLDADQAYPATIVVIVLSALLAGLWLVPSMDWGARESVLMFAGLAVAANPYVATLKYGTHAAALLVVLAAMILLLHMERDALAGAMLGVAVTLRLFPALLLLPLVIAGRRRAALSALTVTVAVNLAGLFLFGLDAGHAIAGVLQSGDVWAGFSGNGSLVTPLVRAGVSPLTAGVLVGAVGVGAVLLASRRTSPTRALMIALLISVMVSPLSWEHYDLILILVFGYLAHEAFLGGGSRFQKAIVVAWIVFQLLLGWFATSWDVEGYFTGNWWMLIMGRLLLLAGLVAGPLGEESRAQPRNRESTGSMWGSAWVANVANLAAVGGWISRRSLDADHPTHRRITMFATTLRSTAGLDRGTRSDDTLGDSGIVS